MKKRGVCIDLRNQEHVKWWNNIASKLVKTVSYQTIVETATNKPVAVVFVIEGLLANFIFKQNSRFIKNPVTTTMKIES